MDRLIERERIVDRINELFVATDARDWPRVARCFTPAVLFDMSSLTGQPPRETPAGEIVDGWKTGLAGVDAIHHQTGNFRVEVRDRDADAFCYGIAFHFRKTASGRNTRSFVGSYDFHLLRDEEWRIDRFRFNAKFVDGNLDLENDR